MNFERYLMEQVEMHPSVQPQDIVKMCYQAAYGAEHLLSDLQGARRYLGEEYAATEARDTALYENISDTVCRVNLSAWRFRGLPLQWLFRMFAASAENRDGRAFSVYLKTAGRAADEGRLPFGPEAWKRYLEEYESPAPGMQSDGAEKVSSGPVHHSHQYREAEGPAYRIVDRRYVRLFPLLEKISELPATRHPCIIAIDGRAASGKSTMARLLCRILDAAVVQMDDFFLPPSLRTQQRYDEPGGNVHYERFLEEVLPFLALPECFSYRIFDCGKKDYVGECTVENKSFRIVEGSYSCHPRFGNYASLTVFSVLEPGEQLRRISLRNGEALAELFQKKWIPLEEKYFEEYGIAEKADIRLD